MERAREFIYSLLLLMVIAIGWLSSAIHLDCHCTEEHHHCQEGAECANHTSAIEHHCAVEDLDGEVEYIVSSQQRIIPLVALMLLDIVSVDLLPEEIPTHKAPADWGIYRGFDPTCAQLRAPPALL